MGTSRKRIGDILDTARAGRRSALLEAEGNHLLEAAGFSLPPFIFVPRGDRIAAGELPASDAGRLVVKVNAASILHKTDAGGVAVVARDADAVNAAIADMESRFAQTDLAGFTVHAFVPYERAPGRELLLGARWTDDFGPVVVVGAGGVHTEFLAANLREDRGVSVVSAQAPDTERRTAVEANAVAALASRSMRGRPAAVEAAVLHDAVSRMAQLARETMPDRIREIEINPLVVHNGGLHALDVLVRLGNGTLPEPAARPLVKMKHLLEPRSVVIMGVSQNMNPGRVILRNMLRDGFDPASIRVIKPGADEIDGCRCVPDIAALQDRADLFVLSIDAAQAAEAVAQIIERRAAESIIVIPGGLEEKSGSEAIVGRMRVALEASRHSDWGGPLINGGNCLGVQSRPGRYDTLFIPEHKIGTRDAHGASIAFISQSGAFAVSKNSKLAAVDRKYTITLGNQMDLTVGDYLTHLADDEEIAVYAVYAEGFRPLDGARFLEAARGISASGRHVVLYRAGRTAAGARASASHTASIAGDYAVTRALARAAGVIVADTIADFEDIVQMLSWMRGKTLGRRLGAVSNAGFECVAIADNLGSLELAPFSKETVRTLGDILDAARIGSVVDVHNPLDLTPMTADAPYEAAVATVIADPGVDCAVVGCVPLTPALNSLPAGEGHREDVASDSSVASRLARVIAGQPKFGVAVVDGGALYDAMAAQLTARGIPTFRTADRALRLLDMAVSAHTRGANTRW